MKKLLAVVFGLFCATAWAEDYGITDEKVKQYILITNNTEKCFEPKLWNAKTEEARQAILAQEDSRQQNDRYRHDMSLLLEIFGDELGAELMRSGVVLESTFNQKVQQFQHRQTTVKAAEDCQQLSEYRYQLLRKHYYGEK